MNNESPPLEALNKTELLQILATASSGSYRLRVDTPKERLVHLIRTGEPPTQAEISQTGETRKQLQYWIREVAWRSINSQLPCTGDDRGTCVTYPCSEGRHMACFLGAKRHL